MSISRLHKRTRGFAAAILVIFQAVLYTGCAASGLFSSSLLLNGRLETTQINVSAQVPGIIHQVFKQEGETVKKGDVLASVESTLSEAEVKQKEINVKIKEVKLDGLKSKKGNQAEESAQVAELELENARIELEIAREKLKQCSITAPVDGTLISSNVNVGDGVDAGTVIGRIADMSKLSAKLFIPQKYLSRISLNQTIDLTSVSLPGATIKGKIVFIASQSEVLPEDIDKEEAEKNTVFEVRVGIQDHISRLKHGMTVDAAIPKLK
jgi:HlyD family secretion protein